MSGRKHYFGAGPAALPAGVLQEFAEAVLDYQNSGISILSIAHRGAAFQAIRDEASELALDLAGLSSEEYEVLWLQGGGRLQFTMLPMNFLDPDSRAGYIDSGHWAQSALKAAEPFGQVEVLSSTADINYTRLPDWPATVPADLRYLHITTNNTIFGTQIPVIPECTVPLVADMSSDIFSQRREYQNCDLIYAVAQKNIGASGVTLIFARKSFLKSERKGLPEVLSYNAQAKAGSMLNTPPVAAVYSCLLMLRWTAARGIAAIETENSEKAGLLYQTIDESRLFHSTIEKNSRSRMNVVFRMNDPAQEAAFLQLCRSRNIEGIKGHRSVGGFRVSLYNAVTLNDVQVLVQTMKDFEFSTKNSS